MGLEQQEASRFQRGHPEEGGSQSAPDALSAAAAAVLQAGAGEHFPSPFGCYAVTETAVTMGEGGPGVSALTRRRIATLDGGTKPPPSAYKPPSPVSLKPSVQAGLLSQPKAQAQPANPKKTDER